MKLAPRTTEYLAIAGIVVRDRLRALRPEAIADLADGMKAIGMRTPISVRMTSEENGYDAILVTGHHRLEAARSLGWEKIECFVVETEGEDDARRWEIAENLHRGDLTKLERAKHVCEWIRLSDKLAQLGPALGGKGKEGGVRAAARELGISHAESERAIKIGGMSDEAMAEAERVGLDRNQAALEIAARSDKPQQAAVIRDIAEAGSVTSFKASKIDGDIAHRAAVSVAEWIVEHANGNDLDAIKANLFATTSKAIAIELTNLLGSSIMDRRYA